MPLYMVCAAIIVVSIIVILFAEQLVDAYFALMAPSGVPIFEEES